MTLLATALFEALRDLPACKELDLEQVREIAETIAAAVSAWMRHKVQEQAGMQL